MEPNDSEATFTRRGLLRTGAGAAAAGATAGAAGAASAQQEPYDGFLSDANMYRGTTADRTGQDSVTVQVGAGDQGLAFSPPAIVVDPGTTVTWEWTGNGGGHNVVNEAEQAVFDSGETVSAAGETYEFTFEQEQAGWHPYICEPHSGIGMKGVVAVGIDNAMGQVGEPEEIELLSTAAVFGGAAVGGGVTLLGLAVRGMNNGDEA